MDRTQHARSLPLLGENGLEALQNARVAVFGVGGVGGHLCEALARAGVGELHLFDKDTVSLSNINRQAVALHSTVGQPKVEVMKARIADINPECRVFAHEVFYLPENADEYDLSKFDYIADAIDTVSAKIELICRAKAWTSRSFRPWVRATSLTLPPSAWPILPKRKPAPWRASCAASWAHAASSIFAWCIPRKSPAPRSYRVSTASTHPHRSPLCRPQWGL